MSEVIITTPTVDPEGLTSPAEAVVSETADLGGYSSQVAQTAERVASLFHGVAERAQAVHETRINWQQNAAERFSEGRDAALTTAKDIGSSIGGALKTAGFITIGLGAMGFHVGKKVFDRASEVSKDRYGQARQHLIDRKAAAIKRLGDRKAKREELRKAKAAAQEKAREERVAAQEKAREAREAAERKAREDALAKRQKALARKEERRAERRQTFYRGIELATDTYESAKDRAKRTGEAVTTFFVRAKESGMAAHEAWATAWNNYGKDTEFLVDDDEIAAARV